MPESGPTLLQNLLISPVLVGRDTELAGLTTLLSLASKNEGQVALLTSEAGGGKTRLVSVFKEIASQAGFTILQGECFEQDQTLPYSFLLDLLRRQLNRQAAMIDSSVFAPLAADLSSLLPELQDLLPSSRGSASASPEHDKQRLYYALQNFFVGHMISRPLLVVFEDVHWSDTAGLEFLLYWLRQVSSWPLLLLLTYRNENISAQLAHLLTELNRTRHAHVFFLQPLNMYEAELMLRNIFGQDKPVSSEFVHKIHNLTEGNPFFIEEVLKSLVNSGEISFRDGKWNRPTVENLQVPESVGISVQQRIRQLETRAQDLIKLSAVIGRHFDYQLLVELTGREKLEIVLDLRALVSAQLVVEQQDGIFFFRHALTREAVYADLLELERRHFHELIAQTLERLHNQELDDYASELSYHHYQSGNWQKVIDYSQKAGEKALALHAPREALVEFSRLLESAGKTGLIVGAHLYTQRGRAYEILGDFERARLDYERALQLARQAQDQLALWEGLIDLGFLWLEKDYLLAGEYLQQALDLAAVLDDPTFLARSLNRYGNWFLNREKPLEAIKYHKQALEIFSRTENQQGLAETLDLIGAAHSMGSSFLDSYTYFERALVLFDQTGDRRGMSSSLAMMAENSPTLFIDSTSLFALPLQKAITFGKGSLDIAREIGWRSGSSYSHSVLGVCYGSLGEYGLAFEHAQSAQQVAEEINHLQWATLARIVLGAVYLDIFSFASARHEMESAYSQAVELNSLFWMRYSAGILGTIYISEGQLGQAARILNAALEKDDALDTLGQRLCWVARLQLALERKMPAQAVEIAERLLAQVIHVETTPILPWQFPPRLLMLYGEALWMAKRHSDAETQLKAALESAGTGGSRSLAWRIHRLLGHCYHSQRRYESAELEYASARGLLADLAGAIPSVDLRENFVHKTGQLIPRFPASSSLRHEKRRYGGLTRREREIAQRLSQGLSNRRIAEDLILSERTVERHVSHILDKLGFDSRSQIISWALQTELTEGLE